jgi:hypothetical protein
VSFATTVSAPNRDYNETKSMGSFSSSTRTSDQTTGAFFWNAGTASYLWNHLALSLIEARGGEDGDRDNNDTPVRPGDLIPANDSVGRRSFDAEGCTAVPPS